MTSDRQLNAGDRQDEPEPGSHLEQIRRMARELPTVEPGLYSEEAKARAAKDREPSVIEKIDRRFGVIS